MSKAGQAYNGVEWVQFRLTTADITLDTGIVANQFYFVKDSQDNIYIICWSSTTQTWWKIIKITSSGIVTRARFKFSDSYIGNDLGYFTPFIILSRDELSIFAGGQVINTAKACLMHIELDFTDNVDFSSTKIITSVAYNGLLSSIYQDRYIWTTSGTTISVYDYTTKALIASATGFILGATNAFANTLYSMCLSSNNELYIIGEYGGYSLNKVTLNGTVLASTRLVVADFSNNKQMLIDKWGDLVILTNSGTASHLLKYTTAGDLIEDKTLLYPSFNLNTDSEGNYYFQTNIKTYQIIANDAQGEVFSSAGIEIRSSGAIGFSSNFTGYSPSVNCD